MPRFDQSAFAQHAPRSEAEQGKAQPIEQAGQQLVSLRAAQGGATAPSEGRGHDGRLSRRLSLHAARPTLTWLGVAETRSRLE